MVKKIILLSLFEMSVIGMMPIAVTTLQGLAINHSKEIANHLNNN